MNMIRPSRDYKAIRKSNRTARWNRIKWSFQSLLGFAAYILSLAIITLAIYIIAVALM
jgi:hypothetical protein